MLEAVSYLPPPTLHYQSDKAKSPAQPPHLMLWSMIQSIVSSHSSQEGSCQSPASQTLICFASFVHQGAVLSHNSELPPVAAICCVSMRASWALEETKTSHCLIFFFNDLLLAAVSWWWRSDLKHWIVHRGKSSLQMTDPCPRDKDWMVLKKNPICTQTS